MKSLIAIAALSLGAALAAQPASAQLQNGKAPIDVSADQLDTHNVDCTAVYSGSAEALQDTSRLRSDIMIAKMEQTKKAKGGATAATSNACGDMISLEAKGNVYYAAADGRRVHGDNGFYDAVTKIMTITGDVTAVDGQGNVMRGTKMVYNTDTGEGHVEGGGKGAGAKNRPRGVFYPKDSDTSQGDPAKSAPASDTKKKKAAK